MLPAFLTTILFSLSAVTGPKVARMFGATEGNFWRLCVAALALGLYAHTIGQGIAGPGFAIIFISGCIGFGGDITLFQGYVRIGSRLTILIVQCMAAPFAALTEWIWLGNSLAPMEILFAVVILIGVGLALAPGEHIKADRRTMIIGLAYSLFAAYCQGFGAVLSRKGYEVVEANGGHIDGITTAYQRILGGILITGLFLLFVRRREIMERTGWLKTDDDARREEDGKKRGLWKKGWPVLIANGLCGPAFGVSCYQWALLTKETGVVLPIVAMTPLVVIPMARIFEGERPTKRSLAGGLIAVAGAVGLTMATL